MQERKKEQLQSAPAQTTATLPSISTSASNHAEGASRSAISIKEFCARYRISAATFYRRIEEMPTVVWIGRQRRILPEDENAWRRRIKGEQTDAE
jgi:hypothetical protein